MARFISKTHTLLHRRHHHHHLHLKPFSLSLSLRHRSSQSPSLIEIDLPSSSSSSSSSSSERDYEVTMRMFDDLIHRILVKKATPDWLPFVPGSSFWVPPRPSPSNVVDLVHKLTTNNNNNNNSSNTVDLTAEDSLSLATHQGWPSSTFFLTEDEQGNDGDTSVDVNIPEGMEGTVKVKVLTVSENVSHSEDEEG